MISFVSRASTLAALLLSPIAHSFVPSTFGVTRRHAYRIHPQYESNDSFLDVEFEKVDSESTTPTSTTPSNNNDQQEEKESTESPLKKSLLELSLDMDPQWKQARIPFVEGDRYIDCNVAFTVELDDSTYGIGIPCDTAVAVTLEDARDKITYINPSLEENEELIQIMASQLHELLGNDVHLRNTPKILTVTGNLDKYTDKWQDELFMNETVSTQDLLDDSDEDENFFYDFMRRELGEEEFQKTLDECREDGGASIDKEVLDLFNVPGLGDQADDIEGMEKLFQEMMKEYEEGAAADSFTKLGEDLEHEGVALKLIGFNFRDGKSYSLVKLLKPFTIVGKYVEGEKDDLKFELLTPEEEKLVIPRLEQVCQEDLDQAGLSLT